MTRCTNCQTTQGPFVRDADLPGHPVCGHRRRHRATFAEREQRIHECLERRDALGKR